MKSFNQLCFHDDRTCKLPPRELLSAAFSGFSVGGSFRFSDSPPRPGPPRPVAAPVRPGATWVVRGEALSVWLTNWTGSTTPRGHQRSVVLLDVMKEKVRGHQRLLFSSPTDAVGEQWFLGSLAVPGRSSSAFGTPSQGSLHLLTISTSIFYLHLGSIRALEQYWKWLPPRRSWLPLTGSPPGPQSNSDLHYYLFF